MYVTRLISSKRELFLHGAFLDRINGGAALVATVITIVGDTSSSGSIRCLTDDDVTSTYSTVYGCSKDFEGY